MAMAPVTASPSSNSAAKLTKEFSSASESGDTTRMRPCSMSGCRLLRSISSSSTKMARATHPGSAFKISSIRPDIWRLMAQQASRMMQSCKKTMLVDNYILLRTCCFCYCANIGHPISAFTEYFDSSPRVEPVHAEETSELPFGDQPMFEGSQGKVLIALGERFIVCGNSFKSKLALRLAYFEPTLTQFIPCTSGEQLQIFQVTCECFDGNPIVIR